MSAAESLRAHMEAGTDPTVGLDSDQLLHLGSRALRCTTGRDVLRIESELLDEETDPSERRLLAYGLELAEWDPQVLGWFLRQLPGEVLAELDRSADVEQRPFPLERASGAYRCSSCGESSIGDHARIVDRGGLLDGACIDSDDLCYCRACLHSMLRALG